jgi:hypothetical protein
VVCVILKSGGKAMIDGTLDREAACERKRQRILEDLGEGLEERGVHPKVAQERVGRSTITVALDLHHSSVPATIQENTGRDRRSVPQC